MVASRCTAADPPNRRKNNILDLTNRGNPIRLGMADTSDFITDGYPV